MSDGGIGTGMSYCATIRISGDLEQDELKAVIAKIEDILKPVGGQIESEARVSTAAKFDANIQPRQRS